MNKCILQYYVGSLFSKIEELGINVSYFGQYEEKFCDKLPRSGQFLLTCPFRNFDYASNSFNNPVFQMALNCMHLFYTTIKDIIWVEFNIPLNNILLAINFVSDCQSTIS